ncbi:hypothetical protein SY91_05886 [Burkholderia cenocepacia]|nr:hypothetical protein SY91_05886 [Burkholderia cenocepacia]
MSHMSDGPRMADAWHGMSFVFAAPHVHVRIFGGIDAGHPGSLCQFTEGPSVAEQQPPRMQRAVHVVGHGFAEIAQRAALDIDEAMPVIVRERGPQPRGADRLARAADQAQARVEPQRYSVVARPLRWAEPRSRVCGARR